MNTEEIGARIRDLHDLLANPDITPEVAAIYSKELLALCELCAKMFSGDDGSATR